MKESDKWVKCPRCGHKLFQAELKEDGSASLEIKCSSCKTIVTIHISGDTYEASIAEMKQREIDGVRGG